MITRIRRILDWFSGKKYGTSFVNLLKIILSPPTSLKRRIRSKKMIRQIKETEKYYIVYFKVVEHPLYYPKNMPLEALEHVISELCYDFDDHYYEINETKVGTDDVVVDCGAAEGLFSLLIEKRCKKVYVVEPLPDYLDSLKLTFENSENVEIIPYALGAKTGKGILSNENMCSSIITSGEGVNVEISTIDDLFYKKGIRISYIKSDLEGYDLAMLKGAENTIKQYHPKIAVTVYHKPDDGREIEEYLKRINPKYKIILKGVYYNPFKNYMLHAWM